MHSNTHLRMFTNMLIKSMKLDIQRTYIKKNSMKRTSARVLTIKEGVFKLTFELFFHPYTQFRLVNAVE